MSDNNEKLKKQKVAADIRRKIDDKEHELSAYKLGYEQIQESVYHLAQNENILDVDDVRKSLSREDENYEANLGQEQKEIYDLEEEYWHIQKSIQQDNE